MNLALHLSRIARSSPDAPAIGDGTQHVTYDELERRVTRLAAAFLGAGLRPGDRVAILMVNRPELLEVMLACFRAALVAVPINSRLHQAEVEYIVAHAEARIVVAGPEHVSVAQGTTAPVVIALDADYDRLVSSGDGPAAPEDVPASAPAWLFYTSGTTGRPKAATLSHGNLGEMVITCLADVTDYRSSDTVVHAAPLTHGAGLYALAGIARGAFHLVPKTPPFDASGILDLITRTHATVVSFLTPTMVRLLMDALTPGVDLPSLRAIVYGGGPMYAEDLRRAQASFGMILTQIYGLGETPMTVTYLPATVPIRETNEIVSVGTAHPNVDLRLIDESGDEVPSGAIGEVCVRSGVVMSGYWNERDATREVLRDGWLRTGDLGRFDDSGYLYLLDRKKDLIVSGGANIYPREVEEVLISYPGVASVAVIGVPDRHWGEAVHAVIVPRPGATLTAGELIAFCQTRIAGYKKPRSVDFVVELPISGHGKVLKRELRDRWKAMHSDRGPG